MRFGCKVVCALVVFCSMAGACGGSDEPSTSESTESTNAEVDGRIGFSDVEGWVAVSESESAFVVLSVANGGAVSGVFELAKLSDDGLSVESQSSSLSGVLASAGNTFVMEVFEESWPARLVDDTLVISIRSTEGRLRDLRLTAGSADDFNVGVDALDALAFGNQIANAEAQRAADAAADEAAAVDAVRTRTEQLSSKTDLSFERELVESAIVSLQTTSAVAESAECYDAEFLAGDLNYYFDDANSTIMSMVSHVADIVSEAEILRTDADDIFRLSDPEASGVSSQAIIAADAADQFAIIETDFINDAGLRASNAWGDGREQLSERCGTPFGE